MIPVLIMSLILCSYFKRKEYQEISKIIQFTIYKESDSKKFADMKMKYDLEHTHKALCTLVDEIKNEKIDEKKSKLLAFVQDFFIEEDDFLSIPFLDIVNLPNFVESLSPSIKDVYISIHNLWYTYARRDKNAYQLDAKTGNKLISNKIFLPHLYFVPGGRFREAYYWDSHWILLGLLSSNMDEYAFELAKSLTYLIDEFGYVPNGTRQYYVGRSQPPFFGQMLVRLYDANVQQEWVLNEGLAALEKEYKWWMENRHFDEGYRLNRYRVETLNIPRPESFKEDYHRKDKYKDLWGGAESGWDFSSRWNNDEGEICTGDVIPVDLNVYMLMNENIIVKFNKIKLKKLGEKDSESQNGINKDEIIKNDINKDDIKQTDIKQNDKSKNGIKKDDINKNNDYNSNKNDDNTKREDNTNKGDDNANKNIDNTKSDDDNSNNDDNTKSDDYTNKDDMNNHFDIDKPKTNTKSTKDLKKSYFRHDLSNSQPFKQTDTEDIDSIKNKIDQFTKFKTEREAHINLLLWNKEVWNDYNTVTKKHSEAFYFSNITPLFANIEIPNGDMYSILNLYKKELFGYPGGIPASNVEQSTEQWDFPNVWAPLVQMFTEYLSDIEPALSLHVAQSFFKSVYKGMGANKEFHEKYDCQMVGDKGKGGEYEPQEGFGWTNGTVAWMIKKYGNELDTEEDHEKAYEKIVGYLKEKLK